MTSPREPEDLNPRPSPHVQAFEAQLAALQPREDRLDREKLMFLAGQASVVAQPVLPLTARPNWAWPALAGALGGAMAAAIAMLLVRPVPTNDIASNAATPGREFGVVTPSPSDSVTNRLAVDLAALRGLDDGRLLTAGMALRRTPRLLVAAAPTAPAEEAPRDAPPTPRSLTTRSLHEILAPNPAGAFSS